MKNKANTLERADWKDYELQILKMFREEHPTKLVLDDQKHIGRNSGKKRQIDVAIYSKGANVKLYSIVECKYLNRKVTLTYIDSLYGKLDDLGVDKATIVTTKGFTEGVKAYAAKKKIELKEVAYEFLKDYYYLPPSLVPEMFMKATRYELPYCATCDISILYEIGEVYGMAERELLFCPKCKTELTEVRSDANHRVIKLFRGSKVSKKTITETKAKHIYITQSEWQSWIYSTGVIDMEKEKDNYCYLCKHEFCDHPPTHSKSKYKNKNVCSECIMSERTLLLDFKYL